MPRAVVLVSGGEWLGRVAEVEVTFARGIISLGGIGRPCFDDRICCHRNIAKMSRIPAVGVIAAADRSGHVGGRAEVATHRVEGRDGIDAGSVMDIGR